MLDFSDMATWTQRTQSGLKRFYTRQGKLWIEQNPAKDSVWARLAAKGHSIAWEFEGPKLGYTGRMMIDGAILTKAEACEKYIWH